MNPRIVVPIRKRADKEGVRPAELCKQHVSPRLAFLGLIGVHRPIRKTGVHAFDQLDQFALIS